MRAVGLTIFYNCNRCPAYCCSYPRIPVQPSDIERLAQHFGLTARDGRAEVYQERRGARRSGDAPPAGQGLRHDLPLPGPETRRCTVYEARPDICRVYPATARCGYYDFLSFERRAQEDPEFVPSCWNGPKP